MGKWADVKYDDVMIGKTRALFKYAEEKLKKDHPENLFSFENFVETLDENDHDIRRWFELLVREAYKHKNRSRNFGPYSSPPRFRPRSVISASPFLQSFGSSTSPSDFSNDNDSDGDQLDHMSFIALERELRERERDRIPLSSSSSARRSSSRMGIPSEDFSEFYNPSHVRNQPQSMGLPSSSGSSHVFERFRELRERERERETIRRAEARLRAHTSSSSSPYTSSSTSDHTSNFTVTGSSQSETAIQQGYIPLSDFQPYRRLPPTTLGLSPPAPIPDRPSSPSSSPPGSRMVIRRVGIDPRADLRHYMREADPMYLEHRDRSERTLTRDRERFRGARPTHHEGLERESDTTVENTERRRDRDPRVAILRDIERERQFGEVENRVRRAIILSGIPTPPHVTEGEEGEAATTAATGTTAESSA